MNAIQNSWKREGNNFKSTQCDYDHRGTTQRDTALPPPAPSPPTLCVLSLSTGKPPDPGILLEEEIILIKYLDLQIYQISDNLLEILVFVIISSPISSVRGCSPISTPPGDMTPRKWKTVVQGGEDS